MIVAAELSSSSIVIVGDFIPRLFHPLWFKSKGLLGEAEVNQTAKDSSLVIVDDLAQFDIGAFEILVARERFQITTQREDFFAPLRDLVLGSIGAVGESPAKALGINWNVHFPTASEATWHSAGDKLVPKEIWRELWPKHVGMNNLQLRLDRNDAYRGNINITVQPSVKVKYGVYVDINDHFDFGHEQSFTLAGICSAIDREWDLSRDRAQKLFAGLYSKLIPNAT